MDEKEDEMNNKEFETFKKMLALHLAELKELADDKEASTKSRMFYSFYPYNSL